MALKIAPTSKKKADNGRVEDGTYVARIVQIIDLGLQQQTDYKTGEVKTWDDGNPKIMPEVFITFEFPTERIDIDGESKPRWLSKRYTVSLHEKSALTGLIKAADPSGLKGKTYDMTRLADKPVMVSVGSTVNGNAKVTGVSAVPKGLNVDPLENDVVIFDSSDMDMDIYNSLPAFIQEIVDGRVDSKPTKSTSAKPKQVLVDEDSLDEDVPF